MKTNHLYLNVLLTVLAVCLVGILIQNQLLIEELKRERVSAEGYSRAGLGAQRVSNRTPGYALVPVNADGSLDVNITKIDGQDVYQAALPVRAERVDVNVEAVNGIDVDGYKLPVTGH
ncbi:MAG: hypothetical protein ICV83_03325 [Cytophagales bacterium]|nr:hypothetical protein [Cytophagales bacterium]